MSNSERTSFEPGAVSERLSWEVGMLAGQLAHFLAGSFPQAEGPVAVGQAFLQAHYEAVAGGFSLEAWHEKSLAQQPASAPHPLDRLVTALKLSEEEVNLLRLAGMPEEHEGLAAVLRTLHPRGEPRASVALAAQLFCRTPQERVALRAVLETGTIVSSGLIRLTDDAPFFERSLQVAEALWLALHDIDSWPATIQRTTTPVVPNGLEEWFATTPARQAVAALNQQQACTILVTAEHEEMALQRALTLVHHAGLQPFGIRLPLAVATDLERLIQVHALARGGVPVLRLASVDGPGFPTAPAFTNYPGTVVICGREGTVSLHGHRPLLAVPVQRLSVAARERTWRELLPALATQAPLFAARYPIEPAAVAEVVADLQALAEVEGYPPTVETVGSSLRARAGLSLSGGVKLIHPTATWTDLVLPRDHITQLHEAVNRLQLQSQVLDNWGFLRGRLGAHGVRLLFAGPPGTGKTLSAEVLANTLSVDLLVVDISRVVSKWIGETEKNLAAVFDTAECAQAVLFFDEADALFGKRTEISDAHDRYANLETAYLLARLERFEGLAVLATNLRQNIDPAFLRRLEFVIDFAEPDREQRCQLWRCHLPPTAPVAPEVNLSELAALYPVVGGIIRNAAVAAGFLAATAGGPISRHHLMHALRREYEKAGRAFPGVPLNMAVS